MKRIVAFILTAVVLVSLFAGCQVEQEEHFDYKTAYERLSETVIEQGYVLDELTGNGENAVSKGLCVCLGDAVTSTIPEPEAYTSVIAEECGLTVINGGIGGSQMAAHSTAEYDAFSMYRLADAIVSGDWSLQEANIGLISENANGTEHFNSLKEVNWSDVDLLTIAFGVSDVYAGVAIQGEDPMDVKTVNGALRYSLTKLQSAYPEMQILVITPMYRYWYDNDTDSDTRDINGHRYAEWVDGIISVAEEYKVPCLDLYRTSGFNKLTFEYFYIPETGYIPNAKGQKIIGKKIAAALDGMY